MNRPGAVPQTLRGMPGSFGGQQQPQQPQQPQPAGRTVSSRLPNGKLGSNNTGWAFGGGASMGNSAFQTQGRQLGGNVSFAQSLSGSQPATPLDLSEFPSLSNNSQLANAAHSSMWSSSGSRNISAPLQRNPANPGSSQHPGQDDIFSQVPSRITSSHGSFRFGNPSNSAAPPQTQSNHADEFPPLNRTANGDPGSNRGSDLMSSLGLGPSDVSSTGMHSNRGNGLLNALSANSRANESRPSIDMESSGPMKAKRPTEEEEERQRTGQTHEDNSGKHGAVIDKSKQDVDSRLVADAVVEDILGSNSDDEIREVIDPLAGMPTTDKWGIKGLRTLMNNHPDYHAMVVGMDPSSLGLDMSSPDLISTQVYSLFDENLPKPTVFASKFRLPDCYNVTNVQPIETKIQSFNEETLFWIFYSCPADIKQQMAAAELHSRNWRWHRKLQLWLTKDEHMTPQLLGPSHERGYYIVWDTTNWRKDRREITLHYGELDNVLNQPTAGA